MSAATQGTPPCHLVTAETARFLFYDVESLGNVFTVCTYEPTDNILHAFILLDDHQIDPTTGQPLTLPTAEELNNSIWVDNPALVTMAKEIKADPILRIHDLSTDAGTANLVRVLGGITDAEFPHEPYDPSRFPEPLRPVTDTNPAYDPFNSHPFITGYNSLHYDTTILAVFFASRFANFHRSTGTGLDQYGRPIPLAPVTAAQMRRHNDKLFTSDFKEYMPGYLYREAPAMSRAIRDGMVRSGRHLDIARLNETQQHVALKRLLGQLGHQILESDRLSGTNAKVETRADLVDLISYNISDVVGTHLVFSEQVYTGAFDLRAGLIHQYPETVFDHDGDYATPVISQETVRKDRLTMDTSSAKFAGRILAPYRALSDIPGHVADLPAVSFSYPHPDVARETGQPVVNVLDETKKFFYANVDNPQARAEFDQVYAYYRSIEGRNFNADNPSIMSMVDRLHGLLRPSAGAPAFVETRYFDVASRLMATLPVNRQAEDPPTYSTLDTLNDVCARIREYARTCGVGQPEELDKVVTYIQRYYQALAPRLRDELANAGVNPDYTVVYPEPGYADHYNLTDIARLPNNIPYVRNDGSPSSGFATFSTGGIHGAEYNAELHARHVAEDKAVWDRFYLAIDTALDQIADALDPANDQATDKQRDIARQAHEWADHCVNDTDLSAKIPVITDANGVVYDSYDLARAAWWIRKNIRITIPGHMVDGLDKQGVPTGEQVELVIPHGDVVAAGKATHPFLRDTPKGVRNTELFVAKKTKTPPTAPPGFTEHRDTALNKAYVHTSVEPYVIHEDFTSYYPLLLTNMAAFANPDLGTGGSGEGAKDRYRDIFGQKETYGKLMKDKSVDAETRAMYKIMREGVKLILNAASGAADAGHKTPIKVNNIIISMRIIGQLFSWRIGQAQTFAGARIVSTNTDGLYSVLDFDTNQRVLDEHSAAIGVEIEPEPLALVSKDSNNRVEFLINDNPDAPWDMAVASAGGGTLSCFAGPSPRKSLDHPALTDYLLVEYFKLIVAEFVPAVPATDELAGQPLRIDQPMNRHVLSNLMDTMHATMPINKLLTYYQNIIAASPGTNTYLFSVPYTVVAASTEVNPDTDADTDADPETGTTVLAANDPTTLVDPSRMLPDDTRRVPNLLQHYNRVFMVRPDTPDLASHNGRGHHHEKVTVATVKARKVTPASQATREKNNDAPTVADPTAQWLLAQAGVDVNTLRNTNDLVFAKQNRLDPTTPLIVFNETIQHNPDPTQLQTLLSYLDREAYIDMTVATFDNSWRVTL